MINIRNLDLRFYAVISLLVLWASLTFSIALTEIAFVFALIFWVGWQGTDTFFRKRGQAPFPAEKERSPREKGAPPQSVGGQADTASTPGVKSGGHQIKHRVLSRVDWALWAPLALFVIAVVASFFTSEYPKQSFRGLLKIAKPVLVFFMAAGLFRAPKDQKWFDRIFLATFLMVTIDCAIQYTFGKDLLRGFAAQDSKSGLRLVGPFGNFAKMATYLVLVIPVFAMQFLAKFPRLDRRKTSYYALALALAGCTLLYLTRCRGAMLGVTISFFFVFIYKRWFKALGIALLLCLVILSVMPKAMIFHYDITYKEQSLRERFQLWRRALDVIEAKPLTGTGINTYNVAHAKYDKEQHWRVRGYYAHNGYLQLAAEIGLPGIFFFLGFLFMFFRRALRSIKQAPGSPEEYIQLGLLTSLLAFLIYATADNNLQSPPSLMMFWYLAGILMGRQNSTPDNTRCLTSGPRNSTPGVESGGTVSA